MSQVDGNNTHIFERIADVISLEAPAINIGSDATKSGAAAIVTLGHANTLTQVQGNFSVFGNITGEPVSFKGPLTPIAGSAYVGPGFELRCWKQGPAGSTAGRVSMVLEFDNAGSPDFTTDAVPAQINFAAGSIPLQFRPLMTEVATVILYNNTLDQFCVCKIQYRPNGGIDLRHATSTGVAVLAGNFTALTSYEWANGTLDFYKTV